MTLHLVLKSIWFAETESGKKTIEYRAMTELWKKRLWDKRGKLTMVIFHRGYTSRTVTRKITLIDVGPCPIPGWSGDYYRIHFTP